ncbi:MAG TPA: acyl-CoA dehydrogenase family protein [Rhizomicrobium sp.]|jgi:acyl-CoA dehydrogenase
MSSPWINEELALLSQSFARFANKELVPVAAQWDRDRCVDSETWKKLGKAGFLCASIPEAYGGGGGGYGHEAVIAQELARAGLGGGLGTGIGVSCGIVAHYILAYGTEEQKQRWLPAMARGELIGAIAMTEPGTGSDLQNVQTSAKRVGDDYVINGQKTFISNGQKAGLVLVVARTDGGAGASGISLLAVETDKVAGFRRGRNLEKLGMHAQDTSELFFDDVHVPAENLLGLTPGRGFVQLMQQLAWERLSVALNSVVAMERAVATTLTYVRDRRVFGKPLFEFQNTQFVLAECKTQATIARTFVDQLMVKLLAGELDAVTAAMAKWWTTDTLGKVADQCLQLHGGYGFMQEYPIASLWVDARVSRIYAGANEIMKLIIARSL